MNLFLGTAISFSEINLPFDVKDFLGTGMSLFKFVGSFVLLWLAMEFTRKLMDSIKYAFLWDKQYRRHSYDYEYSSGKRATLFFQNTGYAMKQRRNSEFWTDE